MRDVPLADCHTVKYFQNNSIVYHHYFSVRAFVTDFFNCSVDSKPITQRSLCNNISFTNVLIVRGKTERLLKNKANVNIAQIQLNTIKLHLIIIHEVFET
jgi:hypothetical protein